MAQVDPSIPLQVRQPQSPIESISQAAQMSEQFQNIAAQRALREAYAGADTSSPEGQQALIRKVGAASPEAAMKLQTQFQTQAKTKAETRRAEAATSKTELETSLKKAEVLDDAGSVLMYKFTDLTQNKGMAPQDAAVLVSADIPVIKAHLASQRLPDGTPVLSQEQLDRIPNQFDPNKFGPEVMSAKQLRSQLDYQLNIRKEKRSEASQASTERHQRVLEGQGQARLGMEGARLGLERSREAREAAKPLTEEGKLTADLKKGNITEDQYNAAMSKKTGSAAGMGNRAEVYFNRVVGAGNQAAEAAKNLMELPVSSSRGVFGGRTQGPGLFDSARETLTNSMTSQEVQDYNVMVTGIQRNLAAIESSGLAPSGSLTHAMDSVIIKEGDTNLTKMRRMAEIRQIVEKGLEPNLSNPRLPDEQKKLVQGIIDKISQAVPFTQHDITEYQKASRTNPRLTMKGYQSEKMSGKSVGQRGNAPQAAISHLKAHPELREQFKAKYGYLPD